MARWARCWFAVGPGKNSRPVPFSDHKASPSGLDLYESATYGSAISHYTVWCNVRAISYSRLGQSGFRLSAGQALQHLPPDPSVHRTGLLWSGIALLGTRTRGVSLYDRRTGPVYYFYRDPPRTNIWSGSKTMVSISRKDTIDVPL